VRAAPDRQREERRACTGGGLLSSLEHGSPKTVRLFPGGHMGMTPETLPTIADWVRSRWGGRQEEPEPNRLER